MKPQLFKFVFFLFFHVVFLVNAENCPTSQLIDAALFSNDVPKLRKMLGGHTDIDIVFPFFKEGSILGNSVIQCTCDLECHDFDSFFTRSCRWRNEKNGCNGINDELDWIRMRGAWGGPGEGVFMTKDKPDGFFLFVGVQRKIPENYSAMLVSNPIACQEGDGKIRFRHWTSPGVKVRVCIRPPSMGKRYSWCSNPVKRKNDKPATVIIPGSILYMFEIIIEAYGFDFNAFGVQGGAAAIDDISYNTTNIFQCRMIPHRPRLLNVTQQVCSSVNCDFETGNCIKKLGRRWHTSDIAIGSNKTGMISLLEGTFGYAQGPGEATLSVGKLLIPRTYGIQFCFHPLSVGTVLTVVLEPEKSDNKLILFNYTSMDSFSSIWQCKRVFLSVNGTINFIVKNLHSKESYFGLDQIELFDPTTNTKACEQ